MLEIRDLDVYYSKAHVLRGIHLWVGEGELVSVIGPNGAGKTTLFNVLSGLKRDFEGVLKFKGRPLPPRPAEIVRLGLIHCPEGRRWFGDLSVLDNLKLGAYRRTDGQIEQDLEHVYEIFPVLKERKKQAARTLSGGEQQMLAIGRALMAKPDLLLLDEPTLGLAPIVRKAISEALLEIKKSGVTILLAEQNAVFALEHSDRLYLLETGCICKEGTAQEFQRDEYICRCYLGR